jgi:hypothetical protein
MDLYISTAPSLSEREEEGEAAGNIKFLQPQRNIKLKNKLLRGRA